MKVIIIAEKNPPVLFPAGAAVVTTSVIRTIEDLEEHRDADLYIDLDFKADASRVSALSLLPPSRVMVNAVIPTLTEIGRPFIRINGWPGFLERNVHELVVPDPETAVSIKRLYEQLQKPFQLAPDIPGMISARIVAAIINEAWYTWEEGVSSKDDIDVAMKLGTNYPMGPFEWGGHIGLSRINDLLNALSEADTRYLPAASLRKVVEGA